jgi:hypothetical protein
MKMKFASGGIFRGVEGVVSFGFIVGNGGIAKIAEIASCDFTLRGFSLRGLNYKHFV